MRLKVGESFESDISCFTLEVERLKYFLKYYPGTPKDYPGTDTKDENINKLLYQFLYLNNLN